MGFRLASPFRRIVAIRREEGDEVIITGGVDVSVLAEAIAQLGGSFESKSSIVVRVTGPVTHLLWGSPGDWSGAGSIATSFTLINESTIYGKGGNGGSYSSTAAIAVSPDAGVAGGNAIELNGSTVDIDNGGGNIFGGGGGGGAGSAVSVFVGTASFPPPYEWYTEVRGGTGGGGAGGIVSNGGTFALVSVAGVGNVRRIFVKGTPTGSAFDTTGTLTNGLNTATISDASLVGNNGGTAGGGTASQVSVGFAGDGGTFAALGYLGGKGGEFGQAGTNGSNIPPFINFGQTVTDFAASSGGAAGKAISLAGGTANFTAGNNGTQVKGAVS